MRRAPRVRPGGSSPRSRTRQLHREPSRAPTASVEVSESDKERDSGLLSPKVRRGLGSYTRGTDRVLPNVPEEKFSSGAHSFPPPPDTKSSTLATPSSALRTGTRALHERGDDLPRPPVIFACTRRPTPNPPPIPSSNRAFQQGEMPRATRAARRPPSPRSRAPSCTPRCSSASRSQVRRWSTTERAGSS